MGDGVGILKEVSGQAYPPPDKAEKTALRPYEMEHPAEITDRHSPDAFEEVDFHDSFEAFLRRLDKGGVEFVLWLFGTILSGPATLNCIAHKLGVSRSCLERRIRNLKGTLDSSW